MAKTTGPLFSMEASGKFGGALVFGKWKGRPTVRKLVIPSNPQTLTQQNARNAVRVMGAAQHYINLETQLGDGRSVTDQVALTALAPSGQAWNGFLVKSGIGAGAVNYTAGRAAYAALAGGEKTAWDTAAAALTPAILPVAQVTTNGVAATAITSGEVHFLTQYALYLAGVRTTAPGATPPVYA